MYRNAGRLNIIDIRKGIYPGQHNMHNCCLDGHSNYNRASDAHVCPPVRVCVRVCVCVCVCV